MRNILQSWFEDKRSKNPIYQAGTKIRILDCNPLQNGLEISIECSDDRKRRELNFKTFMEQLVKHDSRLFSLSKISVSTHKPINHYDREIMCFAFTGEPFFDHRTIMKKAADFLASLLLMCGISDNRGADMTNRSTIFAYMIENVLPKLESVDPWIVE